VGHGQERRKFNREATMLGFQYKHGDRPLEGYTIQRGVGHGGFGEVYYAVSDSGREVALKAVQGHEQIELRGIRQCMNLKSPHLVTIFDVKYNNDGRPFVIMEYVAGPSLRELLSESPSGLGTQKAAFFLREIAKGLTYLHDQGIVHRDLKPGNIFYEDGYVKIGDYGLSKAISASRHSVQTITVGTVHYMAPEIGQGTYDRGIDVYALGVVLYEMLTGQVPFFGATPGEVLMKHMASEPDLTGIEEPFATVIRRAMQKDPTKRYQSAQEMVEAVFGAEHIRESVSHFRPESLSVAAERVGQRVGAAAPVGGAAGAPGSSADPAFRVGTSHAGGPGGSSAWNEDAPAKGDEAGGWDAVGRRWGDWGREYGRRMGDWGRRMGEWGRRMGQEGPRAAGPMPPMPGRSLDSAWRDMEARELADPKRDPLARRQRRALALISAVVVAVAIGTVWPISRSVDGVVTAFMAFWAIFGAVLGIAFARRQLKLGSEAGLLDRFAYGGSACVLALVLATPTAILREATTRGPGFLGNSGEMVLSILLAIFLVNWRKRSSPARSERVSLGSAFLAGLTGFIVAAICGGSTELTAALLAGISLTTEIFFPFDPEAARRWKDQYMEQKRQSQQASPPPNGVQAPAGTPPPPPSTAANGRRPIPPDGLCAEMRGSPAIAEIDRPVPGFVRGLALLAFLILVGLGIAALIWAGMARHDEEIAVAVSLGIGSLLLAFFCMVKAAQSTYRSWWSSLVKPLLMLSCVECIVVSSLSLGLMRLHSEEELVAIFLIVFPAILFFVLGATTNRFLHSVFGGARPATAPPVHPVESPARQPITWPAGVSTRSCSVALITACLGFIGFGGIHRLYVGKIGTGLLWLCTVGLFYIGTIYDVVKIATGRFRDRYGRPLLVWDTEDELWRRAGTSAPAVAVPSASALAPQPNSKPIRVVDMILSAAGCLFLLIAVLLGLALALRLPEAVAAGLPDAGLQRELTRDFGYSQWPRLVEQLGMTLMGISAFISATLLVAARRVDGAAHMFRAILGVIGVVGAAYGILHEAFRNIHWDSLAALVHDHKGALAIESALNAVDGTNAAAAGVVILISIVILGWPARRRQEMTLGPIQ